MIVAFLITVGFVAGVGGEEPSQSSTPTSASSSPVAVGEVEAVTILSGEKATVTVPVQVADGHRVQANPASSEFLVPLQLEIGKVDGLTFGPPVYPESEPYLLEGSDEPLVTYVGEFEVVVPVFAAEETVPGEYLVSGELHFQACNARMCLFPAFVPVELQIVVSESEAPDRLETSQ